MERGCSTAIIGWNRIASPTCQQSQAETAKNAVATAATRACATRRAPWGSLLSRNSTVMCVPRRAATALPVKVSTISRYWAISSVQVRLSFST
jgi:hypothetical protein